MNDINNVIEWIFDVLNSVTEFIAGNLILRILLFLPITCGFIYLVYELFINIAAPTNFGGFNPFEVSHYGFGSISSNLRLSSVSRSAVLHHRKQNELEERKAEQEKRKAEREAERAAREAKRKWEQSQYRMHERVWFDENGKAHQSVTFNRNTISPGMTSLFDEGDIFD